MLPKLNSGFKAFTGFRDIGQYSGWCCRAENATERNDGIGGWRLVDGNGGVFRLAPPFEMVSHVIDAANVKQYYRIGDGPPALSQQASDQQQ